MSTLLVDLVPTLGVPRPWRRGGAGRPHRTMKRIGVMGLALALALAVSAVTAASALAVGPEFDAAEYNPAVEEKGTATNVQGFNGGGVVIDCREATFDTNEEIGILGPGKEATNPRSNSKTLITHPVYSGPGASEKCRGTIGAASFPVEVRTTGCNFKTTAAKPSGLPASGKVEILCVGPFAREGEVTEKSAIVKGLSSTKGIFEGELVTTTGACKLTAGTEVARVGPAPAEGGKPALTATEIELTAPAGGVGSATCKESLTFKSQGIENRFLGLAGCIVTVFPQTLTNLAFENRPKTGSATEAEVTIKAEVAEIKSKATAPCGLGNGVVEFKAEYRKGKITTIGGVEMAEIEPPGNPAEIVTRAKRETKNRVVTEGEVTEKSAIVKGLASTSGIVAGYEASSPGSFRIAQAPEVTVKAVLSPTEVELSSPVQGSGSATEKAKLVFEESLPEAIAVGVNEPHWYSQNIGLPAQSGGKGAEGLDIVAWGTLTLKSIVIGELTCQNEFGGDIYNPAGSEFASINNAAGEAEIGKGKLDAFQAYDCTDTECEGMLKSKMSVTAEGLGVSVNGTTKEAEFGEWEGTLLPSGTEVAIGNEEAASPTQIKFLLLCAETTGGKLETHAKGLLHPAIENGTSKGSAPAVLTFSEGTSGELEIGTTKDGKVKGKVKAMGFEGGEFLANKAP